MKRYFEELLILVTQLLMFYVFPAFAVHTQSNGMLIIVVLATFMLSLAIGGISKKKIKYYYPIIIVFLFIPATYIYTAEFIVMHSIWIVASSFLGLVIGDYIMNK